MFTLHRSTALVLSIFIFLFKNSNAQTLPANFQDQLVSNGWSEVEGFRFDITGQMYVWEKAGKVWVVDTNGVKVATPLLDIHEEVGGWRDHGLNGFALDPDFRNNGYYYLFYTVDRYHLLYYGTGGYNAAVDSFYNATIARVTRYTANQATNFTTTVAGSRLVLIGENKKTGIPVLHESHSGGQLIFGTDGSLLVSTGDGASYNGIDSGSRSDTYWQRALNDTIIRIKENVGAFRSQLVDCLNGKILRIDPATGNGLPSNPFYNASNPGSRRAKVWAMGLRNPFRMTLKPGTGNTDITAGDPGAIYIGDVGWGTWEDLHVVKESGKNLGWPLFEGLAKHAGYLSASPYNQDAANPLYGMGGCTQQFFRFRDLLVQDTLGTPSFPNPCNSSQQVPSSILKFMHSRPAVDWYHASDNARTGIFNGTSASEILINNALSPVQGQIYRGNASVGGAWYLGNKYPVSHQNSYFHADFGQSWIKKFNFDSNNDPDSVVNFGSGMGPVVFLEYNPKDEWLYYVKYPSDIRRIIYNGSVNNPPTAIASQNILYGSAPLSVNFTGANSTDPENLPLSYSWNFGDGTLNSTSPNPSHVFSAPNSNPVTYNVVLTVTDNVNQVSSTSLKVFVNNTPPQVSITSFNDGDLYTMSGNTILPLQANVFDAEHGPSQLFYSWTTFLHHNNHEHPEASDTNKIASTTITPEGCNGETFYFRIQLTVTDAAGLSTTISSNIYPACDPPEAFFTSNTNKVCQGGTINFIDNSTNLPDSWQWSFPGGNPAISSLENPPVVYSSAGTFDVSLIVTSIQGADTLLMPGIIQVYSNPQAIITPSGTDSVCSGIAVLLNSNTGSNLSYQWIKNNVNIPGANLLSYNATASGTYKVKVVRTTTGCNKTSTGKKIVYRAKPSALITPDGPTTFCNGDSVVFSAPIVAGNTYGWKKNGVYISSAINSSYAAKTAGNYRVVVTDQHGCSKTSEVVVVVVNCRLAGEDLAEFDGFNVEIFPNPVSGKATLSIVTDAEDKIDVQFFDAIGKQLNSPFRSFACQIGGNYFDFDATSFLPGIYFVKITSLRTSKTIRMIVAENENR
ncbi:MAG: PKD domain-containing protein [Bacteroidia bacterium]